jgi:acyl phosphate:glycerol-3-phosphate acyltransferase
MTAICAAGAILLAYLLGSTPIGVMSARLIKGVDIRLIGSGRTGATNAYRAAGPWGLALTSVGDIFKGVIAIWAARFLMMLAPSQVWAPWVVTAAGIAAVCGHNWSIFLGFKGGAGTVTTMGILLAMNPYVAIGVAIAGLIALSIGRAASIASITVAVLMIAALVIAAATHITPWAYVVFGAVAGTLTIWALRPNIRRLLTREERRLKINR